MAPPSPLAAWVAALRLEYQGDNLLTWFVASALAIATDGRFDWQWFVLGLLMLICAQAALELLDGYYDFIQGAHAAKAEGEQVWSGGSGALASGALQPRQVKRVAWVLGLTAGALFAVMCVGRTGWWGFGIGVAGALAGAGWAMPPFKLSYRGLGEVTVAVVAGPLLAAQAWVVASGRFDVRALWVGVPFGLLELAMALVHGMADRLRDAQAGKRTLVVRLGDAFAARAHVATLVAVYAALAASIVVGVLPRAAAVAFAMVPLAWHSARSALAAAADRSRLPALMDHFPAYRLHALTGLTLVIVSALQLPRATGAALGLAFVGCYAPVALTLLRRGRGQSIYERFATLYDPVSRLLGYEATLRRRAVMSLGAIEGQPVLDVGCGTGLSLPDWWVAVGPRGSVVGIDPSGRSLSLATQKAERLGLAFEARQLDAAVCPLPDGRFAGAIAIFALSVIPDWQQALSSLHRALRPGAAVAVLEQRYATLGVARLANPMARLFNRFLEADPTRDFEGAMRAAGFETRTELLLGGLYALHVGTRRPA